MNVQYYYLAELESLEIGKGIWPWNNESLNDGKFLPPFSLSQITLDDLQVSSFAFLSFMSPLQVFLPPPSLFHDSNICCHTSSTLLQVIEYSHTMSRSGLWSIYRANPISLSSFPNHLAEPHLITPPKRHVYTHIGVFWDIQCWNERARRFSKSFFTSSTRFLMLFSL